MKEALYYEKLKEGIVRCTLCPHNCVIRPGKNGICLTRGNREGILYSLHYGRVSGLAIDPIEKKPLYHFYPGRPILSFGVIGCNFSCRGCQNWHLVVGRTSLHPLSPEDAVRIAREEGSIGISYTYNEPFITYEYLYDTAKLVHEAGLVNVLVTNGYINPEPLEELIPYIDAMNIDLKGIRDEFYRTYCRARVEPVKETIRYSYKRCHIEVTNLIIPQLNDKPEDIEGLVEFLASIDPSIPLHISRYFPHYKMETPATPVSTLQTAYEIAVKKMKYVYLGNIDMGVGNNTYCSRCGNLLVARRGYYVRRVGIEGTMCARCGEEVPFVMEKD